MDGLYRGSASVRKREVVYPVTRSGVIRTQFVDSSYSGIRIRESVREITGSKSIRRSTHIPHPIESEYMIVGGKRITHREGRGGVIPVYPNGSTVLS